jgi:hypothetical protein
MKECFFQLLRGCVDCLHSLHCSPGINILGVVENMSSIAIPLTELKNSHSNIRLVNSRGENMTDSVLFRCVAIYMHF